MAQKQIMTPLGAVPGVGDTVELFDEEQVSASDNTPLRGNKDSPLRGNNDTPLRGNNDSPLRGTRSITPGQNKRRRSVVASPYSGDDKHDESGELSSSSDSDCRKWLPPRTSGSRENRKRTTRDRDYSDSDSDSEGAESLFDPSSLCNNDTQTTIPRKIRKYIEKFANNGISKRVRQDITKDCPRPDSKKLAAKETDTFVKKLCRQKFNQPLSSKKEKTIINTQLRILDAVGPLSMLWSEAERLKKKRKHVDPRDVISITQRALVLIGNAHYVYMTDRRRSMLGRLLPDSVDLLEDKQGKKALLKSKTRLFGRKFMRLLSSESQDNRELSKLLPVKKRNSSGRRHYDQPGSSQFFRGGPSRRPQFGGQAFRARGRFRGRSRSRYPNSGQHGQ